MLAPRRCSGEPAESSDPTMTYHTIVALILLLIASALARADQAKDVVIFAEALAHADQRADAPTPGKWWLKRDAQQWGAPNGIILMTGQPSEIPPKRGLWEVSPAARYTPTRVPSLVVDPKVSGWHRIYLSVY